MKTKTIKVDYLARVEGEGALYVKLRGSLPSQNVWVPWDDKAEETAIADFDTLMKSTNFLEDMTVELNEHRFPNGATGHHEIVVRVE